MIVQDISKIDKITKADKEGFLKAYKVIYSRDVPYFTEYAKEYCNTYKDNCSLLDYTFIYQLGLNVARHNEDYPINPREPDIIREGLHLMLTLKDAQEWIKMSYNKIVEVYYKKEDVIAYGFLQGTKIQGVIVKQLIIKSLEGIKL